MPNGALDSTKVGAPLRLPARLTNPTSRNETTVPTTPDRIDCHRLSP
jgi:hypothetical protein